MWFDPTLPDPLIGCGPLTIEPFSSFIYKIVLDYGSDRSLKILTGVLENWTSHPIGQLDGSCHGPLAQLVEQLTLNQRVRSSSLRRPTNNLRSKLLEHWSI